MSESFLPVRGLRTASEVTITLFVLAHACATCASWFAYAAVQEKGSGADTDYFSSLTDGVSLTLRCAAGVVFLVWLWRARHNAEQLSPAPHRRSRGWVIGSWVCPVVNLWFPYQIVTDVWKASRPDDRALIGLSGRRLLRWWWACWLPADTISHITMGDTWRSHEDAGLAAIVDTFATALLVASALLVVRLMRQISDWQSRTASLLATVG